MHIKIHATSSSLNLPARLPMSTKSTRSHNVSFSSPSADDFSKMALVAAVRPLLLLSSQKYRNVGATDLFQLIFHHEAEAL